MIKVNQYYDGNIKSLGSARSGQAFTVGIIEPGEYTIPTTTEEHVSIMLGNCRVKITGKDWMDVKEEDNFIVPAGSEISFDVKETVAYLCLYRK